MSTDTVERTATGSVKVMTQRQIMLVIIGLMCGMFLSSLDQTVVGTAIRTIGDDLNGLEQQAWVTTAYLIVSTITTPIYGKLSDIFGRRPLYIFAIAVFILGSILETFSQSMLELAAFRAVQGIGAGGLMSLPLAIMGDILAPRERAKYQGYFLAVFGISSIVGPLIGGLFAGADQILWITGWRWVFLINVPVGIIALLMVIAFLHLPRFHGHSTRIDWWGATTVVIALVPLLLVAEEGSSWGWLSGGAWACYIVSTIGIVAFILIERRMGSDAIIPLGLFRSEAFSMSIVLGVLVGFGMFGAMLTIPLYLQIVLGMNPTESGFATLPMLVGLMVASIVSGQIISKTGGYRVFPIIGAGFTLAGFAWLVFLRADSSFWAFLAPAMLLIGLGLGQLMQPLVLAAQNAVEPKDMGVATSSSTFFRQIGGTIGVAVMISVLFAVLPGNIKSAMSDETDLHAALDAALDPAVATAPANAGVMAQIWTPVVDEIKTNAAAQLPPGVTIDWSNAEQRGKIVDQVTPTIAAALNEGSGSGSGSEVSASTSDTSYLKGADPRLTKPFLTGFSNGADLIFFVGAIILALTFLLTFFFRTPPLRRVSAAQEMANARAKAEAEAEAGEQRAAAEAVGRADEAVGDSFPAL